MTVARLEVSGPATEAHRADAIRYAQQMWTAIPTNRHDVIAVLWDQALAPVPITVRVVPEASTGIPLVVLVADRYPAQITAW